MRKEKLKSGYFIEWWILDDHIAPLFAENEAVDSRMQHGSRDAGDGMRSETGDGRQNRFSIDKGIIAGLAMIFESLVRVGRVD